MRRIVLPVFTLIVAVGACRNAQAPASMVQTSAGEASAAPVSVTPTPDAQSRGPVRLDGRAFADDSGPFNALGVSLFWALWAEKHAPERLDATLAFLARHGVDYVRILAMVGAPSWEDRVIDPAWPDYWETVDAFFERLGRHDLRAQVTLFADAQVMMPDRAAREAFVDAWAARATAWRDRVLFVEIANEHWQNGLPDIADVRALGRRLRSLTDVPVALSAPREHEVTAMYADWSGGVATLHYDRSVTGPDGPWGPVRQPWRWPGAYFRDDPGIVAVNAEPIGPQASVAEDDDPLRLALAFVTTFVAGNAAYTYHTGAGVRGGGAADLARGRLVDVQDYDPRIIGALAHWRRALPAGLPNFTRHDAASSSMPWAGSDAAAERGDIVAAYAATDGRRLVGVVLGVRRPHEIQAQRDVRFDLLDPVDGSVVASAELRAGQRWTVPAGRAGYVVLGTFLE